nr:hypothetical protein [Tanacetum cinerariifolium]
MTGNKAHLVDYQEFKGGSVTFGGSNERITGKGKIKAGMLDFGDVYYVEELKHCNLFSVSQMCDKKNKVLFTDIDCLVLSPDFKLPDENQVLLKIPRQHNMYSFNLKNIDFFGDLASLFAKASIDESNKWHRRIVTKPQNKTPYELLTGRQPIISYLRPFECHVTILNTINQLGKFDGKSDSSFLAGYSLNSKAFKVYNLETKRVEENLHVNFLENKPNVAGKGHAWMFDLDYLKKSMNYEHVSVENQANKSAGPKEANNSAGTQASDQGAHSEEIDLHDEHFVLPIWSAYSTTVKSSELEKLKRQEKEANNAARKELTHENQDANTDSTNLLNVVSTPISTDGPSKALNDGEPLYPGDPLMPHLKDIYASLSEGIFTDSSYDDEGVVTDFNNLETTMNVSPTPTTRIQTIHPKTQILRDPLSTIQTRSKVNKNSEAHALKAIRTKWVYKNKKDEWGVVVRNKARLVTQGHRQEEGIDYDEVFAPVARIESIRIFLAFASYMGFIVYQMDVKSAFLYGTIDEEVYVTQPHGFVDPKFPNKVYKVVKALYGLHQAPRAWYATLFTFMEKNDIIFGSTKKSLYDEFEEFMKNMFQMSSMGELSSFLDYSVKTASTSIETQKPLVKDEEAADVDVHLYRFQVTPKTSHLQAVKRIFRYLKGQPKLGLWYPEVSSFDLEAYSNSDYAGVNLDKKSTTGEAEYVAAAHCCGQVLRIQNQLLDYGFNIMNIKIYIDNESTICIVKNHVFHSKKKHIEIQHHFIRDAYEKKLIQVLKIHTDDNVADLLTKAFDVSQFKLLVVVTEDVIRYDLRLDDADGVDCLPNEEIFTKLARMGYEKPPPKLMFYKAFFSTQ